LAVQQMSPGTMTRRSAPQQASQTRARSPEVRRQVLIHLSPPPQAKHPLTTVIADLTA
jgi:hypothetical protein